MAAQRAGGPLAVLAKAVHSLFKVLLHFIAIPFFSVCYFSQTYLPALHREALSGIAGGSEHSVEDPSAHGLRVGQQLPYAVTQQGTQDR